MLGGRGENLLILKYDGSIEFSGIENTLDKPIEKLRRMVFFAGKGGECLLILYFPISDKAI